jgi:hypothetical protein
LNFQRLSEFRFVFKSKRSVARVAAIVVALFLLTGSSSFGFIFSSVASSIVVRNTLPEAGYQVSSAKPGTFVKIQANWVIPTVDCSSTISGASMQFWVGAGHLYSTADSASELSVTCPGSTPGYSLTYWQGGSNSALPSKFVYTPGDLIQTVATIAILGGEISVQISDLTEGWTFQASGLEAIDTSAPTSVSLIFIQIGSGTSTYPLINFGTIPTTADKATLNGHMGSLGSFLPLTTKFTVVKDVFVDHSNGHVVAKPTAITSTSTGFTIKYIQGS